MSTDLDALIARLRDDNAHWARDRGYDIGSMALAMTDAAAALTDLRRQVTEQDAQLAKDRYDIGALNEILHATEEWRAEERAAAEQRLRQAQAETLDSLEAELRIHLAACRKDWDECEAIAQERGQFGKNKNGEDYHEGRHSATGHAIALIESRRAQAARESE